VRYDTGAGYDGPFSRLLDWWSDHIIGMTWLALGLSVASLVLLAVSAF
jgi:hypothetical protein